eukprot:386918_1
MNLQLNIPESRKDKYLVHGYMRNNLSSLKLVFPNEIIVLCVSFYQINEYFNLIGDFILSSNNKKRITKQGDSAHKTDDKNYGDWNNTTYGAQLISADKSRTNIVKWHLRLIKVHDTCANILIGLMTNPDDDEYITWQAFRNWYRQVHYGMYIGFGSLDSCEGETDGYCEMFQFAQDDIICMELNLKGDCIKYYRNGEDLGIAFGGIERREGLTYRLCVSFCDPNDSIEIV